LGTKGGKEHIGTYCIYIMGSKFHYSQTGSSDPGPIAAKCVHPVLTKSQQHRFTYYSDGRRSVFIPPRHNQNLRLTKKLGKSGLF